MRLPLLWEIPEYTCVYLLELKLLVEKQFHLNSIIAPER